MNTSEQNAEASYHAEVRAIRSIDRVVGNDHWKTEAAENVALGKNILREEIGVFGQYECPNYTNLNEDNLNRLIAHTRQDTAATFAMARSAFRDAHHSKRIAQQNQKVLFVILTISVGILVTLIGLIGTVIGGFA